MIVLLQEIDHKKDSTENPVIAEEKRSLAKVPKATEKKWELGISPQNTGRVIVQDGNSNIFFWESEHKGGNIKVVKSQKAIKVFWNNRLNEEYKFATSKDAVGNLM